MTLLRVALALVFLAGPAGAVAPPDWGKVFGTRLPDAVLTDAAGSEVRLSQMRGATLILQPMFTGCHSTCSIVAARLSRALKDLSVEERGRLRVVSVSFDPSETTAGLEGFEKEFQVDPSLWKVVRGDPAVVQRLLGALDFRSLELAKGNFQHPNLVYVVDGDGVVRDYIFGADLDSGRLSRAIRPTSRALWMSGLMPFVPAFALLGLLTSAFVVVHQLTRPMRRESPR